MNTAAKKSMEEWGGRLGELGFKYGVLLKRNNYTPEERKALEDEILEVMRDLPDELQPLITALAALQ